MIVTLSTHRLKKYKYTHSRTMRNTNVILHCYFFQTACQAVGGALVEIESKAENDFITSLIQREKGNLPNYSLLADTETK